MMAQNKIAYEPIWEVETMRVTPMDRRTTTRPALQARGHLVSEVLMNMMAASQEVRVQCWHEEDQLIACRKALACCQHWHAAIRFIHAQ